MDLAYKSIGSGPPIIVLHGLFGMSDNWMSVAKALSKDYTFYLVDLRNHGRSPHSDALSFQLMAEDVAHFLETHQLNQVTLLGHSLGGKVAINVADQFPKYLEKLVVVDIANKVYQTSYFEEYIDVMLQMNLNEIKTRSDAEKAFMQQRKVDIAVLQFLLKNLYREDDGTFKWRLNLTALKENINNILTDVKLNSPVKIETLFMKGSQSTYISAEDEKNIKRDFENVRIKTIPGANHWVHSSAQQNFINALLDF